MAAARAVKGQREKRKISAFEEIFKEVDRHSTGTISRQEYLEIFSAQGASLTEDELASLNRQVARAGGNLRKDDFVRLVRNSATFHKTFDKNKDNVVTKSEMATRCELAFRALDLNNKGPYRDLTTYNNLLYGFISEPELEKLTRKLSERERGRLMSKLDKDGDGQVSYEEFEKVFGPALNIKKK